jgi:hypothetical protein
MATAYMPMTVKISMSLSYSLVKVRCGCDGWGRGPSTGLVRTVLLSPLERSPMWNTSTIP